MKLMIFVCGLVLASSAFAANAVQKRAPSSEMPTGNWQCSENGGEFEYVYVRNDGTSKNAKFSHVKADPNDSSCYVANLEWTDSGKVQKDVNCCPAGTN